MTIEELEKYIDIELQWLRYYSLEKTREKLNENSDIYSDLKSIGYTKRVVPLYSRCSPCTLTSDDVITENTNISDIKKAEFNVRGDNKFTPVETFIKLFPERKIEIINRLKQYKLNI